MVPAQAVVCITGEETQIRKLTLQRTTGDLSVLSSGERETLFSLWNISKSLERGCWTASLLLNIIILECLRIQTS